MSTEEIKFASKNEHTLKKDFKSLCSIEGEWTNYIKFSNKKYWSIDDYTIGPFFKEESFILKSDSSLREDLNYLINGDIDNSQKKKE